MGLFHRNIGTQPPGDAHAAARQTVQNPLTLVMKIKSPEDFQKLEARIRQIQSVPPEKNPIWIALDKLKIVHFARFVFLENNTKLAIITTYDGSFEDYLNEFIDEIGDVFNALLQHMEEAPPLPVQQNREAFHRYVKAHDLAASSLFTVPIPRQRCLTSRQRWTKPDLEARIRAESMSVLARLPCSPRDA